MKQPGKGRKRGSWIKWLLVVMAGGVLALVIGCGAAYVLTDVPAPNKLATAQATTITFSDGSEMSRVGAQNRVLVTIDEISDAAQKAVLAAEDRSYYTEPGISPKGIARALFTNIKGGGGVQQGGSTITQQYAKNAFLSSERTYSRKLKEVFIAVKLSRTQTKSQILEDYLNTIYFGRGASGIEAAARQYFGVSAKDLSVSQAAVLASSIRSPSGYDPEKFPGKSMDRWRYVLDGMVTKGWLSAADRDRAVYPSVLSRAAGPTNNDRSGAKGYVISKVEDEIDQNPTLKDLMASGGLTITTTIDKAAQAAAVVAMNAAVPRARTKADPVGALVSIQPGDGAVRAYVGGQTGNGGTDYAGGSTFLRQPGSSFKPYTLAAALTKGSALDTRLDGASPQQICGQTIKNDEGDPPLGQTDLVTGLQLSVNTVYFRLACQLGPKNVADLAHAAGIPAAVRLSTDKGVVGSGIALGIYEVHVIDQAAGYATFAAGGQAAVPYFIAKVASAGSTVYEAKPQTSQAFSSDVAADTTTAMQAVVVAPGTGTRAQLDGRPTAGKTGTTTNNVDAWFCGFTPQLATAVWVGRPDQGSLRGVLGVAGGISGGRVPAAIFKAYMDVALKGKPVMAFPARSNASQTPWVIPSSTTVPVPPSAAASASASPRPTDSPSPSGGPSLVPVSPASPSAPLTSPSPSQRPSAPPSPAAQAPRGRSGSPSSGAPSSAPPAPEQSAQAQPASQPSSAPASPAGQEPNGSAAGPAAAPPA